MFLKKMSILNIIASRGNDLLFERNDSSSVILVVSYLVAVFDIGGSGKSKV